MPTQRFDLSGKTALITGAAGLLGCEHAAALLECDATVVLTDISEQQLAETKRKLDIEFPLGNILAYEMDVSRPEAIHSVHEALSDKGIEVDILVNNAAIDPKVKDNAGIVETSRLENFPREQWDLQLAVGLTGAFLCSQIFGSAMAKSGRGGIILNISSDLSVIAPDQRLYRKDGLTTDMQSVKPVTYSVIKAGIVGLTRYLATYWTDQGVRSNALSP